MSDRGWILNPAAIAAAKACILVVQEELGVKLRLSHPQFIELLNEYCELTASAKLETAYLKLMSFAEAKNKESKVRRKSTVVQPSTNTSNSDRVTFKGKSYLRYDQSGREFQGLYRGGARYA